MVGFTMNAIIPLLNALSLICNESVLALNILTTTLYRSHHYRRYRGLNETFPGWRKWYYFNKIHLIGTFFSCYPIKSSTQLLCSQCKCLNLQSGNLLSPPFLATPLFYFPTVNIKQNITGLAAGDTVLSGLTSWEIRCQ